MTEDTEILADALRHKIHTAKDVVTLYADGEVLGAIDWEGNEIQTVHVEQGLSEDVDELTLSARDDRGNLTAMVISRYEAGQLAALPDEELAQIYEILMGENPIVDLEYTSEDLDQFRRKLAQVSAPAPSADRSEIASRLAQYQPEEMEIIVRTSDPTSLKHSIVVDTDMVLGREDDERDEPKNQGCFRDDTKHITVADGYRRDNYYGFSMEPVDYSKKPEFRISLADEHTFHEVGHLTDYAISPSEDTPLSLELLTEDTLSLVHDDIDKLCEPGSKERTLQLMGELIYGTLEPSLEEKGFVENLFRIVTHATGFKIHAMLEGFSPHGEEEYPMELIAYSTQVINVAALELRSECEDIDREDAIELSKEILGMFSPALRDVMEQYYQTRDDYLEQLREQQGPLREYLAEQNGNLPEGLRAPDLPQTKLLDGARVSGRSLATAAAATNSVQARL